MSWLDFACQHVYPGGFRLDIGFEMHQRFTALFGPSGSGKSSILSMIAGCVRPQTGRITLGGKTLLDTSQRICLPPERRHVGVVYQDSLLFPHLTVQGNLRYGQRRRRERREIDFTRVVKVLELAPLLDRFPRNLSGGERQRVALGRALLSGPELLLMDEPLASLDAELKVRVLTYLERIVAEWDIPTLYVTHAQAEVRRAASWAVVIQRGRLVSAGVPEEALSCPEPLGWANSAGPMNLLRLDAASGEHAADGQARVEGQLLTLPPVSATATVSAFVQFAPRDVILTRQDVTGVSARNHLRGRVRRVITAAQSVFVAIDIGQVFWAEITPAAARDLDLQPGAEVVCLLKTHHLQVLE